MGSNISRSELVSSANRGGWDWGWLDQVRKKPTQSSWAGSGTELGIIVPFIYAELFTIFQDHSLIEDACV